MTVNHFQDEHCTLVDDECTECGVCHGDECIECGGRGFHKPGCLDSDATGVPVSVPA